MEIGAEHAATAGSLGSHEERQVGRDCSQPLGGVGGVGPRRAGPSAALRRYVLPLLAAASQTLCSPDLGARPRARRPLEGTPAPHTATASPLQSVQAPRPL